MASSTVNQIITPSDEKFFLAPQFPLQRQYEAIRAFLVDDEPSGDVARRFGYSPAAFRVLCHQFRHDPQKRLFLPPPAAWTANYSRTRPRSGLSHSHAQAQSLGL